MKYIKYTFIGLGIIIVVFLLLGVVKPQVTYDCGVEVNKSLAESWAVSQDQEKMSKWLIGFQKIEHISGVEGEIGAVSDVYFNTDGQEIKIRETITDIKPNESVAMSFTTDFMDMDYTLSMKEIEGKTKIYSNTVAKGNGMVAKSMMVLIGGSLKEQEETNLANLKKVIEGNTKDYFQVDSIENTAMEGNER